VVTAELPMLFLRARIHEPMGTVVGGAVLAAAVVGRVVVVRKAVVVRVVVAAAAAVVVTVELHAVGSSTKRVMYVLLEGLCHIPVW
jgi:hypothetical protein